MYAMVADAVSLIRVIVCSLYVCIVIVCCRAMVRQVIDGWL